MKTTLFILFFWVFAVFTACSQQKPHAMESKIQYNQLTPEEERVIIHKGTEAPFVGKYTNNKEEGTYSCKRCNVPLYNSNDKFDSHCGWPSFDDEIKGAVKRFPDADGQRVEIVCANCGGHLGHVFEGEGLTDKNIRHCVNSISLIFVPKGKQAATQRALFAGGCFWGMEYYFGKTPGVIRTSVGFAGGKTPNPTYEQVSEGNTGYAETIEVEFDPSKTTYEALAKLFFEIHDPGQVDHQGPDYGPQYRSAAYYFNEEQHKTLLKLVDILKSKGYSVVTEIEKAGPFYAADEHHQDYYSKTGGTPYCHKKVQKF